jgi:protein-tyrosine-phosphatase
MFQHRRLKELPYTGGVSVVAEAESVDPRLGKMALDLLRALQWDGVAMVEFRFDSDTGRAALLEVNGRYWGSLPLSFRAGLDFPALRRAALLGEARQVEPYRVGVRIRSTSAAISRMLGILSDWRAGKLPSRRFLGECAGFLADFGPRTYDAIWWWRDPAPAIAEYTYFLRLAVRSLKRRLVPKPLADIRAIQSSEGLGVAWLMARRLWFRRTPRSSSLPAAPKSILFICSGNILRSPMSEALLLRRFTSTDATDIRVASAGLHAKTGRGADLRGIDAARKLGVDLSNHRAQLLTDELVANFDVIIGMDVQNEAIYLSRFRSPEAQRKFRLLGDLVFNGRTIEDPYSGSQADIERTYLRLQEAIDILGGQLH